MGWLAGRWKRRVAADHCMLVVGVASASLSVLFTVFLTMALFSEFMEGRRPC